VPKSTQDHANAKQTHEAYPVPEKGVIVVFRFDPSTETYGQDTEQYVRDKHIRFRQFQSEEPEIDGLYGN
jgi:hypothetical protein